MLIRQTLLYLPAGVLGPLLQLGTILVWTYWLAPAELGAYTLLIAMQDLLHLICIAWWSQYVLRYDGAAAAPRAGVMTTERGLLILAGLAQAAAVPVLALAVLDLPFDPLLLGSLAVAAAARSAVTHWSVRARAEQRIALYAMAQVLAPGLGLALAVLLFNQGAAALAVVFLAMAIAHVVVAVAMAFRLGGLRRDARLDPELLRVAFRYGSLTTVGALFAWVSIQSIRFTNEALLGTAAVGLLAVGWGTGQRVASQIGMLATTAALPLAVARAREAGREAGLAQLSYGGYLLVAALLPASVGVSLLSAPISRLITGAGYQEATALILPYAMFAGAARVLRHDYLDEVLQLIERPGLMSLLDAVEASLTVVFCVLGAFWGGMVGSVAGCLLAAASTTMLAVVILSRRGVMPDIRPLWRPVLSVSAMALLLSLLPTPEGLGLVGLHVGLGGLVYLGAMLVLDRHLPGKLARFRH